MKVRISILKMLFAFEKFVLKNFFAFSFCFENAPSTSNAKADKPQGRIMFFPCKAESKERLSRIIYSFFPIGSA